MNYDCRDCAETDVELSKHEETNPGMGLLIMLGVTVGFWGPVLYWILH